MSDKALKEQEGQDVCCSGIRKYNPNLNLMKTYTYTVRVMLTVFWAACSKSATEPLETETPASTKGDYTILLETSGSLTTARLQATGDD